MESVRENIRLCVFFLVSLSLIYLIYGNWFKRYIILLLEIAKCRVSKELYAPALGGIMLSIGIKLSIDDFALAFKRSNLFLAFKTRSSCLNVLLNSFEFRLSQTSTSVFRVCVTICGETSSWCVGGKGIPHASDVLCWFRPHVLRCWGSAIQLC